MLDLTSMLGSDMIDLQSELGNALEAMIMNKDEILMKFRKESQMQGTDERERHEAMKAGNVSMSFGAAICFIMVLLKTILNDVNSMDIVTYSCFCIYSSMACVRYLWLAVCIKKLACWLLAVFFTCIFVVCGILFVLELLK